MTKSKRQLTETHGDPFAVAQGYIYLEVYFDTGSYNGSEKRKVDINGGEVMSLPYQE
ncbi:hypothetical protein [Alkaliphilus hydrothermalis]|uniref:Uncharacterized protein n=1 Tax=Alkaliphilus hydrothermalis TaxID=1482730 RepID=A0ABS2NSF1_9FIRM|nr:hypothetical protein [Alkaliphilus hydrothermalis]MBM7615877.1 hypothetical protein [Alkaliphilus hydrothermalis]